MVRSKDVPKKPRNPLLTPPSKLGGVGFLDDGGRRGNRGGAAMSPTPASVPNYMRGTSSSDAKGGRRRARLVATAAPASASPERRRTVAAVGVVTRGKVLFPEAPAPAPGSVSGPGLGRATCSSTLKGAKFPDALDLAPGATDAKGPAAMRVCPYTYCSLNGHAHAPAVPLRSFLASRRRLIKSQQSMKLKGVSAFRKKSADKDGAGAGTVIPAAKIAPLIDEEAVGDFFVEVYAGPRLSSSSDMSLDEVDSAVRKMEFLVFDRCDADEDSDKLNYPVVGGDDESDGRLEEKDGAGAYRDSSSVCSDAVISGDFVEELPWMRYHGSEYDSLDDGISEEQRMRDDEIDQAQISEEQGRASNNGASDELGDWCEQETAEEHEGNDEGNISNSVLESEIAEEQEGVACRVEAYQELDRRDEDNILDSLCHGEPSDGQVAAEDEFPDHVGKSDFPSQEVAEREDGSILEEGCIEAASADQQAEDDESSMKSDGGSVVMPDDSSEMEISEHSISNGGRGEDFSDEVTSKAVSAEDVSEQHDNIADESTANDVFEQQGIPDNVKCNAQKESGITKSEIESASEGSDIVYNIVDSMKDAQKEIEVATYKKEESCEESGTAHGSNPGSISTCFDDGSQMEPKVTTCISKDASVESDVSEGGSPDGNATHVVDGTEMEPEITRCKVEDSYGEPGIGQGTLEVDDSVCVKDDAQNDDSEMTECGLGDASKVPRCISKGASVESDVSGGGSLDGNAEHVVGGTGMESEITRCKLEDSCGEPGIDQGTSEDDDSVCVKAEAQNDNSEMIECRMGDASKDSSTNGEAEECDSLPNVRSGTQNESNHTTSKLALGISGDTENESNLNTCQPDDVSEESGMGQDSLYDGISAAYSTGGTQNESDLTNFESEGAQEDSDDIKEDESKGDISYSQKKLESTVCESGGPFERPAMPQETDTVQKEFTLLKLDASENIETAEENNESINVEIPEPKSDWTVECHVEPQDITAEVTDAKEPSVDDICNAFSGMNLKGDVYFDPDESATCPRNKMIISRRRRTPDEEEYLRGFNPRAPNFLPLELDPDAEKVDLRHQMVDERKNAEEWMIDYALRRALTNLAPARKKKVELLVQAFETVLPHDEVDKKSMTPPRSVETCN